MTHICEFKETAISSFKIHLTTRHDLASHDPRASRLYDSEVKQKVLA